MARSLLLVLPLGAGLLFAGPARAVDTADAQNRAEIVHVLNRISYGPRPGDVEAVEKVGLQNYIQQQLHPETLDDSAVETTVAQFELVQMSAKDLTNLYIQERLALKQKKDEKRKEQQQQTEKMAAAPSADGTPPMAPADTLAPRPRRKALMAQNAMPPPMMDENAQPKPAMSEGDILPPVDPLGMGPAGRKGGMLKYAEEIAGQWRSVAAVGQLEQAKLIRAVDSKRQLQEVLVDFWGNHFNIDVKKNEDSILKIVDDREVIRPHIWGKFRELLGASARSPAMLHYLDNATNTAERMAGPLEQKIRDAYMQKMGAAPDATVAKPLKPKKQGGINENYAREIMELHTLGVDGGYTQKDVQEVARCFTGWSYSRLTGEFEFHARQHDNGAKVVLGHDIPAGGGIQDGETVMDILCANPATAHHIAYQMCQRFVSDEPSAPLVDKIAAVFTSSGGDLRQVTEAILTSQEFLAPSSYGNKVKSPLEFTVSAVRASDSTLIAKQPAPFDRIVPTLEGAGVMGRGQAAERIAKTQRQSLNWHILELGQPLFACTPPTGYKETSTVWVSPGALIERLNFALALTQQQVADVRFDSKRVLDGADLDKPEAVLDRCVSQLLSNNISDGTRKVLEKTALPETGSGKTVDAPKLIALIIGSPEFQRK